MIKKIFWFLSTLALLAALAGGTALYWFVVLHPGEAIKPDNIKGILGKESPVFYNDGKTRLGVFFKKAHRQYVVYDEIPVNFINALVASEDNRFFSHFGFDIMGIARAAIKNIQSGRIVQGGSTLTQQTAKNLFKRQNRSFKAKLKELLFALRLEYHYSKEKIFEFYANQFYVSGNGHGLGVAARYYFDKKPEELNLLQCAYIAGSVKRPNAYNPFIKRTRENKQKALERGRIRVNYVLAKMLELGMISEYQYGLAKVSDIGFKKGRVGYSLDYVMEMVKDAVATPEVEEALEQHNISNISTSGVRIITTVDQVMQERTLYSLRHDLSRLDVRLRGYEREQVQKELAELDYEGDTSLKKHAFLFGRVTSKEYSGQDLRIEVDLGRRRGVGVIEKDGIARLVEARVRWQKTPWAVAKEADYKGFVGQFEVGDKVWVSVRNVNEEGTSLDLEKYPEVNGGAMVMKDGVIMAMAGGVQNRFYNRAIYARRPMGSSFKPFVYAAALQLGWNSGDLLRNSRDVFIFQGQPYFPRPDHHSPFDEVSMSWAGVKSENVASVWLLSHLFDKLSSEQFREVAAYVDMAPREIEDSRESYSRFRNRIRDTYGIVVTRDILRKAAYQQAVKNIEADLIFAGRSAASAIFSRMHYGLGFRRFKEEVDEELGDGTQRLSRSRREELELRQQILSGNYLAMESLRHTLKDYRRNVLFGMEDRDTFSGTNREFSSSGQDDRRGRLYYDHRADSYSFFNDPAKSGGMSPVSGRSLRSYLLRLTNNQQERFWNNIMLNRRVSVEAFDILSNQISQELKKLEEQAAYSMDVLEQISDYRLMVGLKYIIAFAKALGVESELKPVLSFPLGSNVVTLEETLRIYEALATGSVVGSGHYDSGSTTLLSVLERIESPEGEILYTPERQKRNLLTPKISLVVGHILENVIKYGTGRYADKHVKLEEIAENSGKDSFDGLGLSIPLLGKTGTANSYTNASFFGFLPAVSPRDSGLSMEDGYTVGVYVGFDDNTPMRKGATRIAGSAGALPVWTEIVKAVVARKEYVSVLDPVDLSFYGLQLKRRQLEQKNIAVDPERGGIIPQKAQVVGEGQRYTPSILTFGRIDESGRFVPERLFAPFWRVSSIVENTLRN